MAECLLFAALRPLGGCGAMCGTTQRRACTCSARVIRSHSWRTLAGFIDCEEEREVLLHAAASYGRRVWVTSHTTR